MNSSTNNNPIFIDFEASSLSFISYPIEIAWGNSINKIQSFLISPKNVSGWNDWSIQSQFVHGIDRGILFSKGIDPNIIAHKITNELVNMKVYSDNPDYDAMWMKTLFDATEIDYPDIDLLHLDSLLIETICPDSFNRIEHLPKLIEIKMKARKIVNYQHRAKYDVWYLIETWNLSKIYRKSLL